MIRDERGLSLTELLLVLAIGGMIVGVLATAIYQIFDITAWGNNELVVQHDLQNAATWLNRDVLTASRAKIDAPEAGSYEMTLEVPHLSADEVVTTAIRYTYYTDTYSEEEKRGTLTRSSGGSSLTVARYVIANPFPPLGTDIYAPDPVMVELHSREGDVPGSGTFALKMRAGGFIRVEGLCQIVGDEHLVIDSNTVRWNITSNGGDTASIEQIIIDWPSDDDDNGGLALITFGLDTNAILTEERASSPATIIKPSWAPGDRTIDSGPPKTLKFWFVSNAIDDEGQYSIEITFDNGCIVSFH